MTTNPLPATMDIADMPTKAEQDGVPPAYSRTETVPPAACETATALESADGAQHGQGNEWPTDRAVRATVIAVLVILAVIIAAAPFLPSSV